MADWNDQSLTTQSTRVTVTVADAVAEVLSDPDLKLDQVHPNAEGHKALAGKAFDALRKLGYVRTK